MSQTAIEELTLDPPAEDRLLRVEDLQVEYSTKAGPMRAVAGISFTVRRGETLGIVGESGCGKSTAGRAVLRLTPSAGGEIRFDGESVVTASRARMRELRGEMQMIFQDPIGSLNPRRKVRDLVVEGLVVAAVPAAERAVTADRVLREVGLTPERFGDRRARQLSGGQAQRVAIARALAVQPRLLICDEPVSALDVSVQAQVINLLEDLRESYDLTMVFIAHDLGVVKSVSDRVLVMYLGTVVEAGDPDLVYPNPAHPYTRALLDSAPTPGAEGFAGPALTGDIPSPLAPPSGCRFRTRCPMAQALCAEKEPELQGVDGGRQVACHFPLTTI